MVWKGYDGAGGMGGIGRDRWYGRDMTGLVVWEGYDGTGGMEGI